MFPFIEYYIIREGDAVMERRFEICNNYTRDIMMDFAKFQCKHGKINLMYFKYGGIFIICAFLVFYSLNPDVELNELLSNPSWVFAIIAILLSYRVPHNAAKKLYKMLEDTRGLRNTVVFYDEWLEIESVQSENKYYYTQLYKCYETSQYFYLFVQENMCQIIDKSKFTIGDAAGLKEFLEKEAGVKVLLKN